MGEGHDLVDEVPDIATAEVSRKGRYIHTYHGELDDRTDDVRILSVSPDTEDEAISEAFRRTTGDWQNAATHPNIVSVYDRGATPRPWAATERMSGQSLTDARANLSPVETGSVIENVAEGVRNAALYNVTHGALSPDRISIAPDGDELSVRIDDWGLHQAVSTAAKTFEPTPFTAPESVENPAASDERTDVYGLGAIAYYALTGEPPVSNSGSGAAIPGENVTAPSDHDDALSRTVDDVLLQALATDPAERYDSAYAFKTAFLQAYSRVDSGGTDKRVAGAPAPKSGDQDEVNGDRSEASDASPVTTRRTALGLLGVVGIGGGWLALSRTENDEIGPTATGSADSPTATPSESERSTADSSEAEPTDETSSEAEPPPGTLFSDEFEDDTYETSWEFRSGNSPDDDTINERDGLLVHLSDPSYNNGATLYSTAEFSAEGRKRIEARMRTRVPDYWGYGFGFSSAAGTIQVREHKWEGYDRFGVNGVEERPPEYGSEYDDNYEYYDDTHFAKIATATSDTGFTNYSLTVDFDTEEIVRVTRGDSEFQLSLDMQDFGNRYQLSIGIGRGHEVGYEYVRLYDEGSN